VVDVDKEAGLIGEPLQFDLPELHPYAIRAASSLL
jgi:hypothetical protein